MNPAMDASLEMKSFLILLALGLGSSDKLDRTYLPPPGSKFSGGSPGAIQVPLELPKETYSTPLRPLTPGQKDRYSPEDLRPTVGIDRGLPFGIPTDTSHRFPVTPGPQTPFTYLQDKIPTTTTSYAFTTTTIFPPTEGFETTISPVGSIFPSPSTISNIQQQTYPQPSTIGQRQQINNHLPTGFAQPRDQIRGQSSGLAPTPGTNIQQSGFALPSPFPGGLTTHGGRLEYNQPIPPDLNQYQQGIHPSSTISPIPTFNAQAPIFVPQSTYDQKHSVFQHLGVQPPRQQGTFPSSAPQAIVPSFQPGIPFSSNVQGTIDNIPNIPQTGIQRPVQFGQQGPFPSTVASQTNSFQPDTSTQIGGDLDDIRSTLAPGFKVPQSLFTGQKIQTMPGRQPGSNLQFNQLPFGENQLQVNDHSIIPDKQFSTTTPIKASSFVSVDSQNIYKPDFTATSSILPPAFSNQQLFPSTTPASFPFGTTSPSNLYSPITPVYPGISKQDKLDPNKFIRPERPQAESDRNSVILNYENILTPDGFAYTFDTSNGIHADESGTAIGGVKALGSYSYTGDDGKLYSVIYSADENGFQPRGDHLPTPPPVPEAIQRVIDKAVREKEAGVMHDGYYDEGKYGHMMYQERMKHRRPQVKDKIKMNGAGIPNDYVNRFPEANNLKPGTKEKGIRPIKDDIADEYEDETEEASLEITETYDDTRIQPVGRIPSRRPSNRIKEQGDYKNISDGNKRNNKQMNERQKSMESRNESRNQLPPRRKEFERRPVAPELEQSYVESQDIDKESFKESRPLDIENIPGQPNKLTSQTADTRYDLPVGSITREPTTSYRPIETKGQNYNRNRPLPPNIESSEIPYTTDNDLDNKYRIPGASSSYKPSVMSVPTVPEYSSTSYSNGQRSRPKEPLTFQGTQFDNSLGGITSVSSETFNQKDRPPSKQRLGLADNKYLYDEQKSGYQYIPPKNRFMQGGANTFPLPFTEIRKGSSTRLPEMQYESSFNKKTHVQPFITPNVSRAKDDIYEESFGQRFNAKNPVQTSYDKATSLPTNKPNEYDTDREVSDKRITATKIRPESPDSTKISSTRHPSESNRPQFNVEYTASDQDRTSTPGQADYSDHRIDGFSTTPMPSLAPTAFSSTKPQHTTRTQFPATYLPTDSSKSMMMHDETTAPGLPTIGPKGSMTPYVMRTPGSVGNYYESTTVPSFATLNPTSFPSGRPTSRPTFDSRPGISVLPSMLPAVDYSLGSGKPGSTAIRPGTSAIFGIPTSEPITDYFDRTTQSGSKTVRPGTSSRHPEGPEKITYTQNQPSTTFRPNYIFTDRVSQPGERPGESDDEFRKPIGPEQTGQEFAGSTTYRPDYVSSQDLGLPPTETYQSTGFKPSSQIPGGHKDGKPDMFRLGQSGFGKPQLVPLPGPYEGLQLTISPVPVQGSIPSYLRPYGQTSTQRVVGEDFTGPKQPQRFDPETGYLY